MIVLAWQLLITNFYKLKQTRTGSLFGDQTLLFPFSLLNNFLGYGSFLARLGLEIKQQYALYLHLEECRYAFMQSSFTSIKLYKRRKCGLHFLSNLLCIYRTSGRWGPVISSIHWLSIVEKPHLHLLNLLLICPVPTRKFIVVIVHIISHKIPC